MKNRRKEWHVTNWWLYPFKQSIMPTGNNDQMVENRIIPRSPWPIDAKVSCNTISDSSGDFLTVKHIAVRVICIWFSEGLPVFKSYPSPNVLDFLEADIVGYDSPVGGCHWCLPYFFYRFLGQILLLLSKVAVNEKIAHNRNQYNNDYYLHSKNRKHKWHINKSIDTSKVLCKWKYVKDKCVNMWQ